MRKGKALKSGDTIGVVATSSPVKEVESVEQARAELEALGFQVELADTCFLSYGGYLAGTPEQRAAELNRMFADPGIDAIMCLRGGYGSPQILPLLDYSVIRENPKLFIGYSDITALHTAIRQQAGLATLHGPNATPGLLSGIEPLTRDWLLRAMRDPAPLGPVINPQGEEMVCLAPGEARGPIVGGNLALISALMGTPYELDTRGKLLFLEDIGEEPYRIDRMLTQLALGGKLEECAGILVGTWTNCGPDKYPGGFDVLDVLRHVVAPYQKPTIWNLQSGHGLYNLALPFGVQAYMNAAAGMLVIEEGVVV
ncbi:LD-carboxypeptidase [Brevibacillus humidisoli]|uniref:S66 peptidase family protein n=1 Tax=Brevibacillus humidisoli TaxID=2895522 RepID=UPI001E54434B|nr:LD-carboxypeptidase [Brevibacillus humidisoli]UFJ41491.1 LD-carboxypeptidase [Brevibacillus humidisoli]